MASLKTGRFKDEVVPVSVPQRKGDPLLFSEDECPRDTSYENLAAMRPAFKKDGLTTAGNASIISDGGAAVVVMARETAEALSCKIMATIGAQAS
ncbi:MAG: acetyl-CoA acetyltransferase, partial [Deltaproteobacteria bacterium]|nr:acetyl-CoA acetyltransferase [Deltaproteobacteria bacterium]